MSSIACSHALTLAPTLTLLTLALICLHLVGIYPHHVPTTTTHPSELKLRIEEYELLEKVKDGILDLVFVEAPETQLNLRRLPVSADNAEESILNDRACKKRNRGFYKDLQEHLANILEPWGTSDANKDTKYEGWKAAERARWLDDEVKLKACALSAYPCLCNGMQSAERVVLSPGEKAMRDKTMMGTVISKICDALKIPGRDAYVPHTRWHVDRTGPFLL